MHLIETLSCSENAKRFSADSIHRASEGKSQRRRRVARLVARGPALLLFIFLAETSAAGVRAAITITGLRKGVGGGREGRRWRRVTGRHDEAAWTPLAGEISGGPGSGAVARQLEEAVAGGGGPTAATPPEWRPEGGTGESLASLSATG